MSLNQSNWGTLIDNASLNGCGFITGYSLDVLGQITAMNPRCTNESEYWEKTTHLFRPQAIIIELGWEDSFQHLINGQMTSLNQLSYVQMLEQHVKSLVASLRAVCSTPIYFLSVPWSNPGPLPNGQSEPAASATSHDDINTVIKAIASSSKNVHFVDISRYITPSGKYATDVDGGVCRGTDGVELYFSAPGAVRYVQTRCGKALQRGVLSIIRKALVRPEPTLAFKHAPDGSFQCPPRPLDLVGREKSWRWQMATTGSANLRISILCALVSTCTPRASTGSRMDKTIASATRSIGLCTSVTSSSPRASRCSPHRRHLGQVGGAA